MTTVRSSRRNSWIAVVFVVLVADASTSAHRRDEYLQAARVAIDPDRVELTLDLTPGISVAADVLDEIDRDGDAVIAPDEGRAYAERVAGALALDVDGRSLRLEMIESTFPAVGAVLNGEGAMRVRMQASLPSLTGGAHRLRYRNQLRSDVGAYLANALVPASDRVSIVSQRRDPDQRDLTIDYVLRADRASRLRGGAEAAGAAALLWVVLAWRRRNVRFPARRTVLHAGTRDGSE
jgi:hypothetical protein